MTASEESQRIQRIALQRLESLQRAGVLHLPKAAVREDQAAEPAQELTADSPQIAKEPAMPPKKATAKKTVTKSSLSKCQKELALIQHEVAGCTLCGELVQNRTQTVFGVGNPQARLCFFGEAPGADEDRQGEPFVGRAGKLLNDIISKGMGMTRDEIYILNVLKCRPPGNRNPAPDEVTNCRQFFQRQLETIQPEFICCLGAIAAQSLLETTTAVGKLRGQIHDYKGIAVVVTYHPAYLLRNPAAKKETWKDIKLLLDAMELPIPQQS